MAAEDSLNEAAALPAGSFPAGAQALLRELSVLPYENLSKIVAFHRSGSPESAQDLSARWLGNPDSGLGGTCFSLTHWLKLRLDEIGISTAYLMADKRIEPNVHCGLLLRHAGRDYLLDPGYLIFEPLPLPREGLSMTAFLSPNEIRIEDVAGEGVWRLFTGPRVPTRDGGQAPLKHRFDFRRQPVDAAEFERHWEASHRWPMMRYPVLNRVLDGTQYYLQKNNLLIRSERAGEMRKLNDAEVRTAARDLFGLPADLVDEAFGLLPKYGDG
jgi:arylamine N-acetyltransferase